MTSNFLVYKSAVTNSMHSQSNYTPTSQATPQRFTACGGFEESLSYSDCLKNKQFTDKNSLCEKWLPINFDYKQNFIMLTEHIFHKASRKLNAPHMTSSKSIF